MKATEITRTEAGTYRFSVTPEGDFIDVQIVRSHIGNVYVYKSIGGLDPAPVELPDAYMNGYSVIFRVEAVRGMEVTIESESVITACKVMDADGTVADVAVDDDARLFQENGETIMTEDGFDLCLES